MFVVVLAIGIVVFDVPDLFVGVCVYVCVDDSANEVLVSKSFFHVLANE
jgi:hypothetical protein